MRHVFFWVGVGLLAWGLRPGLRAQPTEVADWRGQLSAHYGFIMAHSPVVAHLAVSHPRGYQLDLVRQTDGRADWQHAYGLPEWGFSYQHFDLASPHVLGHLRALSIFMEPTIVASGRQRLSYRLGTGLSHSTQPFHLRDNPTNTALGSRVAAAMLASVHYRYQWHPRWATRLGLAFSHYSNGAMRQPNAGINLVTAQVGLSYQPGAARPAQPRLESAPFVRGWEGQLFLAGGVRENNPVGGPRRPLGGGQLYLNRRMGRLSTLQIGVEGLYSAALRVQIDNTEGLADRAPWRAGLTLGHELHLGRLGVIAQAGHYLYNPVPEVFVNTYFRLGLRYHVGPRWTGGVAVRAHLARAELIEWSVGYRFGRRVW